MSYDYIRQVELTDGSVVPVGHSMFNVCDLGEGERVRFHVFGSTETPLTIVIYGVSGYGHVTITLSYGFIGGSSAHYTYQSHSKSGDITVLSLGMARSHVCAGELRTDCTEYELTMSESMHYTAVVFSAEHTVRPFSESENENCAEDFVECYHLGSLSPLIEGRDYGTLEQRDGYIAGDNIRPRHTKGRIFFVKV